ncbi:MAG: 30S ribosome-binding factor RbfA [Candidatus Aminicenantes bacterium]|nr:30S ribosome-binding factor RbfA [Candidatus Aminicenantes bacterium]
MSYRLEKFASTMKQALGQILMTDSLNPDFKFVTISRITLSGDLKKADIFISSPLIALDEVLKQLQHSQGFIKRQLAKKMILRYMPELRFSKDLGFAFDQKIASMQNKKDYENTDR